MGENGQYQGEFERLVSIVEEIDVRTKESQSLLSSMTNHLGQIAQSTASVARYYAEDTREMSQLAAGKNQVSVYVLVVVLVLCGAYVMAEKVSKGDVEVRIPFIGFEITKGAAQK